MTAEVVKTGSILSAKSLTSLEWASITAAIMRLENDDATFTADSAGIHFASMDPPHVSLIRVEWPNIAFERYSCEKETKFSVRTEDFHKVMARAEPKDSVEITYTDHDTLGITFSNGYRRNFELHLVEGSNAASPIPTVQFDSQIVVKRPTFEKIMKDILVVADQITIHSTAKEVTFSGKSDIGEAKIPIEKDHADLVSMDVVNESKATYSADIIQGILSTVKSAAEVKLEYSARKPLRAEFRLNTEGTILHFYLAPRVSE